MAAILRGEVLVEDVCVVEVPRATANGDDCEDSSGGDETRRSLPGKADSRGPCVVGATTAKAMEMTARTQEIDSQYMRDQNSAGTK